MSPPLVGLLILLCLLAIWYFEWVPPLGAVTFIRIRSGSLHLVRGTVRAPVLSDLTDILRPAGVTTGFICINGERRIVFSRSIPAAIHQPLRNVLASQ
ncbi:MAG: DUF3634 family protein [Verrucomicrobia bacterium]|nr:DUF3634 family protein [Verrucomicrobiota bacterium]